MSASALYQKAKQGGSGMGVADELGRTSEWMTVSPGGEKPFDFNTKNKLRHRVSGAAELYVVCHNNLLYLVIIVHVIVVVFICVCMMYISVCM